MKHLKANILLIISYFVTIGAAAADFPYRSYAPIIFSASEDVNCIYFDSNGLLWLGTYFGLKAYDGYTYKIYKSDAYTPGILPNNVIRSITEDKEGRLWIGTRNGLARMDRRTGTFKTYLLPRQEQRTIYTLYTSPDGTVWIGTDGGLSYYDAKKDKFYTYDSRNSWEMTANGRKQRLGQYSVKAILEDSNGDLLVGTWANGLLRLKKGTNTFLCYPQINSKNSAYSLFLDSRHRLWVGSWGCGVLRIDNPNNVFHPIMHQYPYKVGYFDIFYNIVENRQTKHLWACTREGICSLNTSDPSADWIKYTNIAGTELRYCNGLVKDRNNDMWISTQNSGVIQTTERPSPFRQYSIGKSPNDSPINFTCSILTTDGRWFWLGLNPYGLALYDRTTGKTLFNKEIPGFSSIPDNVFTTSFSAIGSQKNGTLWFATTSYGIIAYKNGVARHFVKENTPMLTDNFVNYFCSSRNGGIWIGTHFGINYVTPKGIMHKIVLKDGKTIIACDVRNIIQADDGSVWLATDNNGIIHLWGGHVNRKGRLTYRIYSPSNHGFPLEDASACLQDKFGRLWAISNGGGLFLYNPKEDRFEAENMDFNQSSTRILAINDDAYGNLWLSTDDALIRMSMSKDEERPNLMVFTKDDGLEDMLFNANCTYSYGNEMFYGSHSGFIAFNPTTIAKVKGQRKSSDKLIVTNLLIDDRPLESLDSAERVKITNAMPPFTKKLTIPAKVKILSIDFSLLTYGNAKKNMYSYKLDGYDDDWHFIGDNHSVTFQNLPAGSYRLKIMAKNGDGIETSLPFDIKIRILPPWYASWWAYLVYIFLIFAIIIAAVYWYRGRLRTQNRLRTGMMLTNITHELMTPLTIVGATIHKLRGLTPQYDDDYTIIDNNLNRTTRMLRQILEVRKSQAGQLVLKVSRQDLATFVNKEVEAIRPMAEERKLSLDIIVPDKEIPAWFDPDKLDKIIYNLVSNAIKYNKEGGRVAVSLSADKDEAVIKVHDTGIGMSKEQLRHLYTRFFDGDYRKQNIKGTGIGLALVHELVQLHHGSINCESRVGEGTTFTVTLPIRKGAYDKSEIDTSTVSSAVDKETIKELSVGDKYVTVKPQTVLVLSNAPVVLVVEDNDELLELMRQTLSKHYRVLTAKNGKQAWNIIQKEKLDLVITDVMMPVMDGLELLHAIKNDKGFWQLPVILLTAKAQEEDKKEGYAAGADAYIVKPFNFDELIIRADSILSNRKKVIQQSEDMADKKEESGTKSHTSNPDMVFVGRAEACVKKHIDDPEFDRETFAKEMLVSSSTLYNKLRALTGKTIIEFINDIRLEEAHRIQQQEPDITITQLSSRVGFNTPKYFSRLYRKKYNGE